MLEDEELDNVMLDSAKTIDIDKFVSADSIGWIFKFILEKFISSMAEMKAQSRTNRSRRQRLFFIKRSNKRWRTKNQLNIS